MADVNNKGALPQLGRGQFLEGQIWTLAPGVSLDDLNKAMFIKHRWSRLQDDISTPTIEILKTFSERGGPSERVLVFLHSPTDVFGNEAPLQHQRVVTLSRGILDDMFVLVVGPKVVEVDALEVEIARLRRKLVELEEKRS